MAGGLHELDPSSHEVLVFGPQSERHQPIEHNQDRNDATEGGQVSRHIALVVLDLIDLVKVKHHRNFGKARLILACVPSITLVVHLKGIELLLRHAKVVNLALLDKIDVIEQLN